jgi:hypothetical protein
MDDDEKTQVDTNLSHFSYSNSIILYVFSLKYQYQF